LALEAGAEAEEASETLAFMLNV